MAKKKKGEGLIAEFKKFISRGNVLDMAVGVIIGGAFNAIVTAVVGMLMSVCTFAIPGGVANLVTILYPMSPAQEGISGIGQSFSAAKITEAVNAYAASVGQTVTENNFAGFQTALLGLYTKHGGRYIFNGAAIIDWGTLINAVISFLIIALTLFVIVKVAATLAKKRDEMKAKALEEYYVKHPEERPVPPEPGKPEPTTNEILLEIKDLLATKKGE